METATTLDVPPVSAPATRDPPRKYANKTKALEAENAARRAKRERNVRQKRDAYTMYGKEVYGNYRQGKP